MPKTLTGFPGGSVVRNPPTNAGDMGLISGLGRYPRRRAWQPTLVYLPGKSHGQGYSPRGSQMSWTQFSNLTKKTLMPSVSAAPRPEQHELWVVSGRSKPWVSSMVSRFSQLSKSSSLANSNHVSSSWESYKSPFAVQKCHTPRQRGWAPDAMSVLLVEGLPTIFTGESVLHGTCPYTELIPSHHPKMN